MKRILLIFIFFTNLVLSSYAFGNIILKVYNNNYKYQAPPNVDSHAPSSVGAYTSKTHNKKLPHIVVEYLGNVKYLNSVVKKSFLLPNPHESISIDFKHSIPHVNVSLYHEEDTLFICNLCDITITHDIKVVEVSLSAKDDKPGFSYPNVEVKLAKN